MSSFQEEYTKRELEAKRQADLKLIEEIKKDNERTEEVNILIPLLLKKYKANPPDIYFWAEYNGDRFIVWPIKDEGGSYDDEVCYQLSEHGELFWTKGSFGRHGYNSYSISKLILNKVEDVEGFVKSGCKGGRSGADDVLLNSLRRLYKPSSPVRVSEQKASGCYIATAVYGSYDAPEVLVLRKFRDEKLEKNIFGRIFISIYYAISPYLAKHLTKEKKITKAVRLFLSKFVDHIH